MPTDQDRRVWKEIDIPTLQKNFHEFEEEALAEQRAYLHHINRLMLSLAESGF